MNDVALIPPEPVLEQAPTPVGTTQDYFDQLVGHLQTPGVRYVDATIRTSFGEVVVVRHAIVVAPPVHYC